MDAPFSRAARRLTGAMGSAAGVVLAIALVARVGTPGSDATGTDVELFVIHHYHRLQAASAISVLALFLLALFAGALAGRLRRVDDATGDVWAPCFGVGAAGALALSGASVAAQGTYQELSHSGAVPQEILELYHLSNGLAAGSGAFLAAALASVALSGVLNGTIPVPLSWLGALGAAVALVSAGGVATSRTTFGILAIAALVILVIWTLAVGLWLLVGGEVPDQAVSPPG